MKKSAVWGLGLFSAAALVAAACSPAPAGDDSGTGGDGASDSGGSSSGGKASGGSKATGGNKATGGTSSGGSSAGGASSGGTGGTDLGGSAGAPFGGQGGEVGTGGVGPVCEPMALQVLTRDDTNSWGVNDFDDVDLVLDCPTTITATWPHEAGWEDADPSEANSEAVKFQLIHPYSSYEDLTGKTIHAELTLVDDGRGPTAENGGYTVYLAVSDSDWTEAATSWSAEYTGQFYGAGEHIAIDFAIPAADSTFDPAQVRQLTIRVENKIWGGPVFDYDTSVMTLDAFTVE